MTRRRCRAAPMRRSRPLPLVLLAVAFTVAACGGVQITGTGSPQPADAASSSTAAGGAQQETASQRHDVAVDRVEVDSDAGALQVRAGADGSATVDRTLRWTGGGKPQVTETVEGTVLRITARCPDNGSGSTDRCEAAFVVTVPKAAAVTADLRAGGITVSGLSGDQTLTTKAGGVRGDDLSAAQVGARSAAGSVDLAFASPPRSVDARSSAGSVTVRVPGGPYAVDATTSVGHPQVDVPTDASAAARITASSTAGDVTVTHS